MQISGNGLKTDPTDPKAQTDLSAVKDRQKRDATAKKQFNMEPGR